MPLSVYWFLPSHGDGRDVAAASGPGRAASRRAPDPAYLSQVAQACDTVGFAGVLVPFGLFCEDPFVVSAAAAAATSRLRFLVAVRTGLVSPLLLAQMVASLQRVTGGRVELNIVSGGDPTEQRRYGDRLAHDDRYARTEELLEVLSGLWQGEPVTLQGRFHDVEQALLVRAEAARPLVHVGGSSEAARDVAAAWADVYLAWGEGPDSLAALLGDARTRASARGRSLATGTRLHVISRDRSEDAWAAAHRLLDGVDPARIDQARQLFARADSEGQRRMAGLHDWSGRDLEIHPNVWAGFALVRPGAGVALVGSHDEVAARIAEYHAIGLDALILSAQPHLEEAWAVAENVLPRLSRLGVALSSRIDAPRAATTLPEAAAASPQAVPG